MINANSYGCQVLSTTISKRLDIYICWILGQVFFFISLHLNLFWIYFSFSYPVSRSDERFLFGSKFVQQVVGHLHTSGPQFTCRGTHRITVKNGQRGHYRGLGSRFLWVDRIQFTGVHTGKKLSCCSVSWHIIGTVKITPASLNPEKPRWHFTETQPQHPEYITITIIFSIAPCRAESSLLITAVAHNNRTDFHPVCLFSFFPAQAGRRRYYAWATWREFLIVFFALNEDFQMFVGANESRKGSHKENQLLV